MQNRPKIQFTIQTSFIVVAIFLFGGNTAIAASRPYLPAENKWPGILPLASGVSKIQAKQQESNTVIWVPYGSQNFSNPGLTQAKDNDVQPEVFAGFQDIDKSSDFAEFAHMKSPRKTATDLAQIYNYSGNATDLKTASLEEEVGSAARTSQLPLAIDEPQTHNIHLAAEEIDPMPDLGYASQEQIAQSTSQINVWADLDS